MWFIPLFNYRVSSVASDAKQIPFIHRSQDNARAQLRANHPSSMRHLGDLSKRNPGARPAGDFHEGERGHATFA